MSGHFLGTELKANMMSGRPTRTKSAIDYAAYPIPPCGNFAKTLSRPSIDAPWLGHSILGPTQAQISIDKEIGLFLKYMEPTTREVARRKDLVQRFSRLISSFGGNCSVQPVGSYVTGLYLPSSDIDMVLTCPANSLYGAQLELRRIYLKIRTSGFASSVEDVLRATVPLIRITDKVTGIEIDLTAAEIHGVKATNAVQKWMRGETEIKKMLIMVVKMFLSIRRCGTTYTGGINSYLLVWMVIAWVTLEWPKIKDDSRTVSRTPGDVSDLTSALASLSVQPQRLPQKKYSVSEIMPAHRTSAVVHLESRLPRYGRALREFFKFYGWRFDYLDRAISIEPSPSYKIKTPSYRITQCYLLSIFDPADGSIDMGLKAYGIKHIQASFKEAYVLLRDAKVHVQDKGAAYPNGILAKLLDGDFTEFVRTKERAAGRT